MSKTYESQGARLSFEEIGEGVPIIFLHPTPLDHTYWIPALKGIGEYRAILPDLRGHGESELGDDLPSGGVAERRGDAIHMP